MCLRVIPIIPSQRTSPSAGGSKPPEKPKMSFFEMYADLMYKGAKMESMTCKRYCKWQWNIRDPDTFDKTRKVFIKQCRIECTSFKDFARASRLI